MLNLPKSTEVNRLIPKEKLIKKLNLSPALKASLKDNVRKITVINELSHKTINIVRGKDVWAVFIVEMQFKQKEADYKLIEALGKQIGQRIVFVLRYEKFGQLAIYRSNKLHYSDWSDFSVITLEISGTDFDAVWNRIVMKLALDEQLSKDFSECNDVSDVDNLIKKQEQRKKLEREIAALEKKIKKETQFNLQAKMKKELVKLKERLTEMTNDYLVKNSKRAEAAEDIMEMTVFLNTNDVNSPYFNRSKAIEIIEKHKQKDVTVAAINSQLSPGFVPYKDATNKMLYDMIHDIRIYTIGKQACDELKG